MNRHCRDLQVCLHDGLRRRRGDMTQPFGSGRPGCVRMKASLVAAAVTMARIMIKLAHEVRDETLRVLKEHEDEL